MEVVKNIAVIICNYNKKDYVKKNICSLKGQSMDSFDIYVVDNASTDNSVEEISSEFGNGIHIIRNAVNLGGSGGFNAGMKEAMKRNYPYLVLLDNDVELKRDCLEILYEDMESRPDIGIMGAKILKMDYPDVIQEFAPSINYETLTFELNHGGEKDEGKLPHLEDCDYVPACALIVRRETVEAIGYMPEENFIYYDDITWGTRCRLAGYQVVANSHATVWHKGGAAVNSTTFASYYLNRNKYKFFMTYFDVENPCEITEKMICERAERILLDVFEGIYSCSNSGRDNLVKTRMDAFLDALAEKCGKTEDYKIRVKEEPEEKFERLFRNADNILLYMNGNWESTRRILYYIYIKGKEWGKEYHVEVINDNRNSAVNGAMDDWRQILGTDIRRSPLKEHSEYDVIFHVCRHVYELKLEKLSHIWVDGWRNVLADEEDFAGYKLFLALYRIFKVCFEDRVREHMRSIHNLGREMTGGRGGDE